jgi:hypothetical protein
MSPSDDVTLDILARAALAAYGGNPVAAVECILIQVMTDRQLLRTVFLPIIRDAVSNQIEPSSRTSSAFLDMVLPNGVRLRDATREQFSAAAELLRRNQKGNGAQTQNGEGPGVSLTKAP